VKRSLVACGIACVPDNSKHAPASALRINRHEITHPHAAPPSDVSANDIIDIAGVDIAPRIPFLLILNISKGGLRNVIAREGIIWALQNWATVFVTQITDDFTVSTIEIMRIQEDVECLLAWWTVGVRSSIYIDIHAVR